VGQPEGKGFVATRKHHVNQLGDAPCETNADVLVDSQVGNGTGRHRYRSRPTAREHLVPAPMVPERQRGAAAVNQDDAWVASHVTPGR
jgi:hypothetical protein